MFVACGIWCLADVLSVSPSSDLINIYGFFSGLPSDAYFFHNEKFFSSESLLTAKKNNNLQRD